MQALLWSSPKIENYLKTWQLARGKNPLYQHLATERIAFLRKGSLDSLTGLDHFIVRDMQLLLSVSLPIKNQLEQKTSELIRLREALLTSLRNFGCSGDSITIERFLSVVFDLLYPSSSTSSRNKKWVQHDSLMEQLSHPECCHRILKNEIKVSNGEEDWRVRVFSVTEYPDEAWALYGNADLIGDFFRNGLNIPTPFCLSFGIYIPEKSKSQAKASLKAARAEQLANSTLRKLIPSTQRISQEWIVVR